MEHQFNFLNTAINQNRLPLIEMISNQRVLIENHMGILAYGSNEITVRVRNGSVRIVGTVLKLALMSKERLIITGCIYEVKMEEEKRK